VDAQGAPIVQREDTIRVGISVPPGEVPAAGWPVIIYAHGTGGDYRSFFDEGIAYRFAQEGFAVVGIDQNLNGDRVSSSTTPDAAFYNFVNPVAGRDNSRQGGADHFALFYMLESATIEQTLPTAHTHHFDMSRVYYFGHSQGGITGPLFIAYEPGIRAAILSGSGGLLYWALLQKKEPIDVGALLASLVRDYPLDEFDNVLALIQMYIEPADPINYARLITQEPPPGCQPKDIFQSEGFTDHYTPDPNIEALANAFGSQLVAPVLHPVEGMAIAARPAVAPPVSGNVADGHTSVLLQYDQDPDSDGHFVIFDRRDARVQSLEFILSADADGHATLTAP
jgi:predicted esterase